ncbi:hypothetical protein Aperf_G00000064431 [Anoplocephala perfoliata]
MEAVSKEDLLECLLLFANGLDSRNSAEIRRCNANSTPEEKSFLKRNNSTFGPKAASVDDQIDEIKQKSKNDLSLEKESEISLVGSDNQSQSNSSVPQFDDFRTCFMKLAKSKYPHLAACFKDNGQNYKFRADFNKALPQPDSTLEVPIGAVSISSSKSLPPSKWKNEAESRENLRFLTPEKAVSTFFSYSQCLLKIAETINPDLFKLLNDRLGRNLRRSSVVISHNSSIKPTLPLEIKPPIVPTRIHAAQTKHITKPILSLKMKGSSSPSLILKPAERPATESALMDAQKTRKFPDNKSHRSAQILDAGSSQSNTYLSKSTQYPFKSNDSSYSVLKQATTRASSQPESSHQIQRNEAAMNGKASVALQINLVDKMEPSFPTSILVESMPPMNSKTNPVNKYKSVSQGKSDLLNSVNKDLNAKMDRKIFAKGSVTPVQKLCSLKATPDSAARPANRNSETQISDNYMALLRLTAHRNGLQKPKSKIPIRSIYQNSEASSVASDNESLSWKFRPPTRSIKSVAKPIDSDPKSLPSLRSRSLDPHVPILTTMQSSTSEISPKSPGEKDRVESAINLDSHCRPCLLKLAHKFDPALFNYLNEREKRT